jgi:hypothetical protein
MTLSFLLYDAQSRIQQGIAHGVWYRTRNSSCAVGCTPYNLSVDLSLMVNILENVTQDKTEELVNTNKYARDFKTK